MLVLPEGICVLRQLRMELETEAGDDYPHGTLTELLVLYDVCTALRLNLFQCMEVLGEQGWRLVQDHMDTPILVPAYQ